MGKYTSGDIRNIALVGHGGSGKTLLCEAILQKLGIVNRVPAGVMDFAPDEKDRGHSIDLSTARISWQSKEITILNVPGYYDFFHNVVSALSVVETAVIVISAMDGITVNTRKAWEIAEKNGLARAIVVTKIDTENANFDNVIADIQKQFGASCAPVTVPNASGKSFAKVTNVLDAKSPETAAYLGKLTEALVETEDTLLNKYLEGQEIPLDTLRKQVGKAMLQKKVVPIMAVVPPLGAGVQELLDVVAEFFPSPLAFPAKRGKAVGQEEEMAFDVSPEAPFSGQVFKIFNDPFGRLVYFRIYSGTLNPATVVYNVKAASLEKIGNILSMIGKEQKAMDRAIAGDIVAVPKVESLQMGDTLVASDKATIVYPRPQYPTPMVALAVLPKSRTDEQKIWAALGKLAEEDATFKIRRDEETHEQIVSGLSNLHLDIMLNRLKNRFKVECTTTIPKIAYLETIMAKGEARYRHKKQSGGHGQFGEVALRIEPTPRGSGFEFVDQIVGGVIPKQFVASSEKGVRGALERGILAGFKVVDVRVAIWDGKTHEVDSSDAAFQMAASKAFQEAFMGAKPVLLEPVENIEITVSAKHMGAITGDLNSKRGRIIGSDMVGDYQTIKAQIPLSEVQTYSTGLKSITGGEGTYTLEFSHYDPVPSYLQDKIIAMAKEAKEKEEKKA